MMVVVVVVVYGWCQKTEDDDDNNVDDEDGDDDDNLLNVIFPIPIQNKFSKNKINKIKAPTFILKSHNGNRGSFGIRHVSNSSLRFLVVAMSQKLIKLFFYNVIL